MKVSALVALFAGIAIAAPVVPAEHKETQIERRNFWTSALKVIGTGVTSGVVGALVKNKIDENKERQRQQQQNQETQRKKEVASHPHHNKQPAPARV